MTSSHVRPRRRWWWPWGHRSRRRDHGATLPPDIVVRAHDLTKVFGQGESVVQALDHVGLDIARARMTAVMGPSGSGKSTLMHLLAGLDTPTSGSVIVDGHDLGSMGDEALTALRRDAIGFVFQGFNLVPTLTARENIALPSQIAGRAVSPERLQQVADAFDLTDRLDHLPSELSGGQQQRVALARAVASAPAVVFADEPTGNLDSSASREVLGLLRSTVDEMGQTVVMVTHDPEAAVWADRVVYLLDGRIAAELDSPTREDLLATLRELGQVGPDAPGTRVIDEYDPPQRAPHQSDPDPRPVAPTTRRSRHEAEDTRTQEIALLAVERLRALEEAVARSAASPDALREELGADPLHGVPTASHTDPELPAESADVVERARRILGELPGPVVPAEK